jgi:hypothetical protein
MWGQYAAIMNLAFVAMHIPIIYNDSKQTKVHMNFLIILPLAVRSKARGAPDESIQTAY